MTVATPIVCSGARRRSVGEPGLKSWKSSFVLVQRQVRVAEDDGVGVREAVAHPAQAPVPRAGVVDHRDPGPARLDDPRQREPCLHLRAVHVPAHGVQRRTEPLERLEHLDLDQVTGVQDRVRGGHQLDRARRDDALSARQVGVADDRESHDEHARRRARRDSNPRLQPPEGCALSTELLARVPAS